MSLKRDSLDKIALYFENLSQKAALSPLFFRDYTCPPGCGGCCHRFSLDYFEGERWERFKKLYPDKVKYFKTRIVGGVKVHTYMQDDHNDHFCRFLDKSNGRCLVHEANPFTCEFELMKVMFNQKTGKATIINKLFGRGWSYQRTDGGRGAKCEMLSFNYEKYRKDLALLEELNDIAEQFKEETVLPQVIEYLKSIDNLLKNGIVPDGKKEFTIQTRRDDL